MHRSRAARVPAGRGRGSRRRSDRSRLRRAPGSPGARVGSRHVALAAVKSLLTFGNRIGYLPVNVGAAVKLPPVRDPLAERILPREAVYRLIDREPDARNRALLKLLYVAGLRVSEATGLRWRALPGAGPGSRAPLARRRRP